MYCKKCGNELDDDAKFCDVCGEKQDLDEETQKTDVDESNVQVAKELSIDEKKEMVSNEISAILDEGKNIVGHLKKKNFNDVIHQLTDSQSKIGICLVIVNALLFAFVSCYNVTQIVNSIIDYAMNTVTSVTSNSLGSLAGNLVSNGTSSLNMKIDVSYDLFVPFMIASLIASASIFVGIFALYKLKKISDKNIATIFNYVGLTCLPSVIALLLNFVIGFFYPPLTIIVYTIAIVYGIVLLYSELQKLYDNDNKFVFEFIVIMVCALVAMFIIFKLGCGLLDDAIEQMLLDGVTSGLQGILSMFGF